MWRYFILLVSFGQPAFSHFETLPIPRAKSYKFLEDGVLIGGSYTSANLERIRFSRDKQAGTERWVIDFSDTESRTIGKKAPRFQLRYVKSPRVENSEHLEAPLLPRFILTFQRISQNFLERRQLKAFLKKSRFIKDIVLYPPLENGDLSMEWILKDSVLFEAHQPKNQEGRLVLDLKNAPL